MTHRLSFRCPLTLPQDVVCHHLHSLNFHDDAVFFFPTLMLTGLPLTKEPLTTLALLPTVSNPCPACPSKPYSCSPYFIAYLPPKQTGLSHLVAGTQHAQHAHNRTKSHHYRGPGTAACRHPLIQHLSRWGSSSPTVWMLLPSLSML